MTESLLDEQLPLKDATQQGKVKLTQKSLELELKNEELTDKRQNREERKKYAKWIFWLLVAYVVVVMVLLYFCGFHLTTLSESVLVTLLSTTTVNMIGIFIVVTKYLFSK